MIPIPNFLTILYTFNKISVEFEGPKDLASSDFFLEIPLALLDIRLALVHNATLHSLSLDIVDILQHLMVKLIHFILEKPSDFLAGQVHLILILQLMLFYLVEVLNHVVYGVSENDVELILVLEVDVLFDEVGVG